MYPGSNYTSITTGTTTVIGPATAAIGPRRINLMGIGVNKTLTGTLVVKSGATTIGSFAIGTPPNIYWQVTNGIEVADLQITTSAGDDVGIFWNNL